MRPREVAGKINAAPECKVFVAYSGHESGGTYLTVSRPQAKQIIADAREKGIDDLDVTVDARGVVYIGDELELDAGVDAAAAEEPEDEDPEPVCSLCGEPWEKGHECEGD
jgi:hypothetical protein